MATDASDRQTILIAAHGHPDMSKGGGEFAAYSQFMELGKRPGVDAYFMARAEAGDGHGTTPFSIRDGGREILWHSTMHDYFRLSTAEKHWVRDEFGGLLANLRPDVVHFHHYLHLGIELLGEVKRVNPETRLMLTLHEYCGICANNGQMVKTGTGELCNKATPEDCHRCFPTQFSPTDFFLRELYLKSYFEQVDLFIAPSEFLRGRYISWGLPADKIVVLENGQEPAEPLPPRDLARGGRRSNFGFFGQITPYKGIQVLLEAVEKLPTRVSQRIRVDIHGANLEFQQPDFRAEVERALAECGSSVRFAGAYRPEQLRDLMAHIDWVIVPSTWWENSPLVIQEAFKFGRPVICSDIGGMAEKVVDGVTGLHFRARNALDLAERLEEAAGSPQLWQRLYEGITPPPTIAECVDSLLDLYAHTPARVAA